MKRRGKNLSNLQEFSKSINYLQTHQIETMDDLQERIEELNGVVSVSKKEISEKRKRLKELENLEKMAAVRSLLFIGKVKKDPTTRVLIHEKSSLAPPGETMAFKLGDEEGFRWVGAYEISADDLLDGKEGKPTETKLQRGTKLIYELLADGNAVTIQELDEKAKA